MQKTEAVAALGQRSLLLPAWIRAALTANDRLKLYLTLLQSAAAQATHPKHAQPDLQDELAAAGLTEAALAGLVTTAHYDHTTLMLPGLAGLVQRLQADLATMARPLLDARSGNQALHAELDQWLAWLAALPSDRLDNPQLASLVNGRDSGPASVHLLIMRMHKLIHQLSAESASEVIAGASVWDLQPADQGRVTAFMRGVNRTAGLKFRHPGLATTATRDGARLLLQNDIGTSDAHVLVLQVTGTTITLTCSDLHRSRLQFFQSQLTPLGAQWSVPEAQTHADLNQGQPFVVGTAQFACADEAALDAALEGIGSRLVFLIDWNHARKRLHAFLPNADAVAVLAEVARLEVGHCAWLQMGGEQLIFAAMQSLGEGAFHIGDRLGEVIGVTDASAFLVAVMQRACEALRTNRPAALVADETRMLLAHYLRQRSAEFNLLAEHAGFCHALAQAVSDGLAHDVTSSLKDAEALAGQAHSWEHKADLLVTQARENAKLQPRWRAIALLAGQADDVADALEEAAFVVSLIADQPGKGWNHDVRDLLNRLAATVLTATRDYVRAIAVARTLNADGDTLDSDAFLDATWRVLQAERHGDDLLRKSRRAILASVQQAPLLMLANDLACTLETASDGLLRAGYSLRDVAFDHIGPRP